MKHLILLCAVFVHLCLSAKQDQLMFIKNQGQWNTDVFFASIRNEADVLLLEDGFVFHLKDLSKFSNHNIEEVQLEEAIPSYAYKMEFIGNNLVQPLVKESCETVFNFFIGNKEEKWRTHVPSASKVVYQNFYDDIDLLVYSANGRLKYDFILHPNANPGLIQWRYQFANGSIDQEGKLNVKAGDFQIEEGLPFTYQRDGSKISEVKCSYQSINGVFSFELDEYDQSRKTIIDPEIVWSTYSNIGRLNRFSVLTTQNQTLFGAETPYSSLILETILLGSAPLVTTFIWPINCLSEDGETLLWLTFISGTDGGGVATNLKITEDGNILIMGTNLSADFPYPFEAMSSQAGLGILLLNATGNEILAGTAVNHFGVQYTTSRIVQFGNLDREGLQSLSAFHDGQQFIISFRYKDLPTINPDNVYGVLNSHSIMLISFDSTFSMINWSTSFGTEEELCDCPLPWVDGCGMHLISARQLNNSILLTGHTWCPMGVVTEDAFDPTFDGECEGFMSLFSLETGTLEYASYFGGDGYDQITECLVVEDGVWIAGTSSTLEFPSNYSVGNEAIFYAKMDHELQNIQHFFKIGQPTSEVSTIDNTFKPNCLQIDDCGNLISGLEYIHNTTPNPPLDINGFPLIDPVQVFGATYYFYYSLGTESIMQSTYLGGGSLHGTEDVYLMNGEVRLAMCAHIGNEAFTSMEAYIPPTPNAYFSFNEEDLNGAETSITNLRFNNLPSGYVTAQASADPLSLACGENVFNFSSGSSAQVHLWDFGNGDTLLSTDGNVQYAFMEPGNYQINYTAIDSSTCNVSDSNSFEINIEPTFSDLQFDWETPQATQPCSYPQELVFTYQGSGHDELLWTLPNGEELSNQDNLTYLIEAPGSYLFSLLAVDQACDTSASQSVNFDFFESLSLQTSIDVTESEELCDQAMVNFDLDASGYTLFQWYWNSQLISEEESFEHQLAPGIQNIELYAQSQLCEQDSTVVFEINLPLENSTHELFIPNIFTPNRLGLNEEFKIVFEHDLALIEFFNISIVNRWGKEIYTSNKPDFTWNGVAMSNGQDVNEGPYYYTISYQIVCSDEVFRKAGEITLLR